MDSQKISPIRILGKKSTNLEVATFLKKELAGDGIKPKKSKMELSQTLGISRPSIDKYVKLADELNIQFTEYKKTAQEKITLNDKQFLENPYIQKWLDNMKARMPSGKQFKGTKPYLRGFYVVCSTLKVNPEVFISGANHDEVLEKGRTLTKNFLELYKEHKATLKYPKNWNLENVNMESVRYMYSKFIRDFMKISGFSYPAGETGIMSQSITALHGKYSDIKISEDIHQAIKKDLIEDFGLDSDEFRYYTFGIEAFPRNLALYGASSKYEESKLQNGKTVFEMEVFESKTSHYKRGIWKKHIFDSELQESIKIVSKKSDFLITDRVFHKFNPYILNTLRKYFRKYRLTSQGQAKLGDEETSYFIKKPAHALRHAGAQRLLLATDWNISYVAKRGWKKAQELSDSYGDMPLEQELKTMERIAF